LRQQHQRTIFVAVAGPSGSGKTTLALKIAKIMPGTLVISLDNYLDATRIVIDRNFDDDRLVDFDLLIKNVKDLKSGRSTEMPLYDFRKSGRYAYKKIDPPESNVVLIEGIHALNANVVPLIDLKISVSGGVHYDLVKRVLRDIQRTWRDASAVLSQITDTVYPMYKAFIEPSLRMADIQIVNTFNPFSGLLSPDYMLKSVINEGQSDKKNADDETKSNYRERIERVVAILRAQKSIGTLTTTNVIKSSSEDLSAMMTEQMNLLTPAEPTRIENYIDIFLLPPEQEESYENDTNGEENEEEEEEVVEESEYEKSANKGRVTVGRNIVNGPTVRDSTQYIRVRNNNGKYWALFSESLREGRFIITPHMEFLIDVKTLGGLMALGYKVDAILNRSSIVYDVFEDNSLTLVIDNVEQVNQTYLQIKGSDQDLVARVASMLSIKNFVTDPYIEIFHKQQQNQKSSLLQSRL